MGPLRFSQLAVLCAAAALPVPARALDIASIDLLWLHDRVDGTPIVDPYGMEAGVELDDDSGLADVRLVTPVGTVDMSTDGGPFNWSIDSGTTTSFANSGDLFTAFPGTGTYTFEFLDGGATVIDSFSIVLGGVTEPTDFLDVTAPSHLGSIPIGSAVEWTCATCDGNAIALFAFDIAGDMDVDEFTSFTPASGSWVPSGLVDGNDYEFEMILGNYVDADAPLETTALLADDFQLIAGFESINIVEATATAPEPGTALLLGSGLLALALRRRGRALS